ncbi:MAG: response regulator [Bacteroidota bacterium]
MIKAIIVDDEPYCCESLATLLERYCPYVKIADVCYSGTHALASINEYKPDIVFLDIEMPGMNGFDVLQQLSTIEFSLIFTTSYDQYAIKAIRFSAMDYLLKPIDREELQEAVRKVAEKKPFVNTQQIGILLEKLTRPSVPMSKIAIPTMEGLLMIAIDTIISCASDSNYTILSLKDNKKIIASRTLKEIEELLEEHSFVRVHHSYLVNLNENKQICKRRRRLSRHERPVNH